MLVVNTASMCGYTYQYAALQRLWSTYRARGLVVLGVPSNDFGGQEPGSAAEIKTFCEVNFDVDFPLTEKVHVKGSDAHPLFVWLRAQLGPELIGLTRAAGRVAHTGERFEDLAHRRRIGLPHLAEPLVHLAQQRLGLLRLALRDQHPGKVARRRDRAGMTLAHHLLERVERPPRRRFRGRPVGARDQDADEHVPRRQRVRMLAAQHALAPLDGLAR